MKLKILSPIFTATAIAVVLCSPASPAQDAPRRIEITAKRFDFTPSEITLKKGEPVVIALTSADVNHGVKVKELNLSIKANKGQTSEVPFTPTQVGTFVGQCSVFCGSGHGRMKMTFHVTE
jgi:cytochrome c oxidase subunit II